MKKYARFLFISLLPFFIYAERPDPMVVRTFDILQSIEARHQLAMEFLKHADEMSIFIPDLEKREHMHALLVSAIASLGAAPNKKVMVITIGLGLIASLSTDMYDKFCEYRRDLIMAQYHMDLYYFYDYVYRHLPRGEISDGQLRRVGVNSFLRGMDYLFYSLRMIYSIHDTLEENEAIVCRLNNLTAWISQKLKEANYRISKKTAKQIHEEAINFCENFLEVLSECKKENVRDTINIHLCEMLKQFELAVKYSSQFIDD